MKFVLNIEENGYELRGWDEENEEVGELLVCSWSMKDIHQCLENLKFKIHMNDLKCAEELFEKKSFVILDEKENKELEIIWDLAMDI